MSAREPVITDLVSVIIPAYNRAAYVGEAIDSILAQTWPHYEILVIDGGWRFLLRLKCTLSAKIDPKPQSKGINFRPKCPKSNYWVLGIWPVAQNAELFRGTLVFGV